VFLQEIGDAIADAGSFHAGWPSGEKLILVDQAQNLGDDHPLPRLFSLAVFLSAALLFLVEPMFARMLLPKLGGAPAVWNTCVVFYQVLLLAGYAYAHLLSRRLNVRLQVAVHLTLAVAAALALPVSVDAAWTPPPSANPNGAVLRVLLVSLGLPFFVLAASGPLLQQWFLWRHGAARNPYSLYAASNVGSLLALLAYPLALEPLLRLRNQSLLWTTGYGVLLILIASCGFAAWNAKPATRHVDGISTTDGNGHGWLARLQWLALAFAPASLMLSVTTFVSTDIAAVPLLWVVPLALYLVTLVVAFADQQIVPRAVVDSAFPAITIGLITLILADEVVPARLAIVAHMAGFAVVALACHMRMAALRPNATRLTEFYLWIAAGGAFGGAFNTFVAPLVFVTPLEYPLTLVVTSSLFPPFVSWPADIKGQARAVAAIVLPVAALVALTLAIRSLEWELFQSTRVRYALMGGPALILAYGLRKAPARLALALALALISGPFLRIERSVTLHVQRNFFGVQRVTDEGFERVLMSGTTNHGSQAVDPSLRCEPLTYYSRGGPIGQVFAHVKGRPVPRRVGIVGLGTASLAAYANPGDSWTFFEINPAVDRVARNPSYFTYLRDCAPDARSVLGDARLSLEREADGSFDVIAVDAFSSDAIPVHLMTTEAIGLYFRKLAPGGLLALHISNRYLDLAPVVVSIAKSRELTVLIQHHEPARQEGVPLASRSTWMVVARRSVDVQPLMATRRWDDPVPSSGPLWTDDYSNVVSVIKR
jgi:hypothetical protein